MKTLLILFLTLNANAYFITEEDFESCQNGGDSHVFHVQEHNCKGKCVEIPDVNCPVFDLEDEMVNGEPIYSEKSNVMACESEEACKALGETLCENSNEFFWQENLVFGFGEAYCASVTGYEQVKSGRKLAKENPEKKAAFEAKVIQDQENARINIEKEIKIQAKLRELAIKEIEKEAK